MVTADSVGQYFASWITFLVISISSSQIAYLAPLIRLPMITGYLLFGILCGPYMLQLVSTNDVGNLQPITQTALAFISFAAGSELYLPELKQLYKRIMSITVCVSIICFICITLVFYGLAHSSLIPFMSTITSNSCKFSVSMLCGSIMVTQSPSSTLAIVRELRAKGQFTSTMLGVCVISDILVLFLFSVCLSITNATCVTGQFDIIAMLSTVGSIVCAVLLGYGCGKLLIFLIWVPHLHGEYIILPVGFGIFKFNEWFVDITSNSLGVGLSVDPLLVCITAGYIISNHSRNRRKFLSFMNKAAPIVFIPFFTLTGAGLNLRVMSECAGMAVVIFIIRGITYLCGVIAGGTYSKMPTQHIQTMWLAMITQAGVSLGIAAEVAIHFSDTWGTQFQSAIIAIVLINQIVGPVLLKWALRKNNEHNKSSADDADELEHGERYRVLIIGVNQYTMGLAQRLLYSDWNIICCDIEQNKLNVCDRLIIPVNENNVHNNINTNTGGISTDHQVIPESTAVATAKQTIDEINNKLADNQHHQMPIDGDTNTDRVAINIPSGDTTAADTATNTTDPVILPNHSDNPHTAAVIPRVDTYHIPMIASTNDSEQYKTELLQHMQQIESKFNIRSSTVHSTVLSLSSDEYNYTLGDYCIHRLGLHRVMCTIYNTVWHTLFTSIGVLPISYYSTATHLLYTAATSTHPSAYMDGTMNWTQSLQYIIEQDHQPLSVHNNELLSLNNTQRNKKLSLHPPPSTSITSGLSLSSHLHTNISHNQQVEFYDALASTAQPTLQNKIKRTLSDAADVFAAHTSHLSESISDDNSDDTLQQLKYSRHASSSNVGIVL